MFSKFFSLVYVEGNWVACASLDSLQLDAGESHAFLSDLRIRFPNSFSAEAFVKEVVQRGGSSEDANQLLKGLLEAKMITQIPAPAFEKDLFLCPPGSSYTDYSAPTVRENEKEAVQKLLDSDSAPSTQEEDNIVWLPHPLWSAPSSFIDKISALLFWGFGRLRLAKLYSITEVELKPVPSNGARHPFYCYVSVNDSPYLPDGQYKYLTSKHALQRISHSKGHQPGIFFTISIVWEREQWRYRTPLSYRDVFLDLGHVRQQIRTVARHYGVRVELADPVKEFSLPPLQEDMTLRVCLKETND